MTEVNLEDEVKKVVSKISKKSSKGRTKNIVMNKKPTIQPQNNVNEFEEVREISNYKFYGFIPQEFNTGLKGIVYKGASIPASKFGKQAIFHQKLTKSQYLNEYLNKYLMLDNVACLNDHLKMIMCYGLLFFESMSTQQLTQEQIEMILRARQQQQEQLKQNDNTENKI